MTTLLDVRVAVQDLLSDLIVLTATTDGSTSTFVDTVNLFDTSNAYIGAQLWFVSGINPGILARVDASTLEIGTFSFTPPLVNPTAEGDVVHMHNLYNEGWTRAELNRKIVTTIGQATNRYMVPRVDAIAGTFNAAAPVIAAPAGVNWVFAVEYQDVTDATVWHEVPPHLWEAHNPDGTVEIVNWIRSDVHGLPVRLRGYGAHPPVVNDSDLILIDPDWIMYKVAAEAAAPKRDTNLSNWAAAWAQKADSLFQEAKQMLEPNARRVR